MCKNCTREMQERSIMDKNVLNSEQNCILVLNKPNIHPKELEKQVQSINLNYIQDYCALRTEYNPHHNVPRSYSRPDGDACRHRFDQSCRIKAPTEKMSTPCIRINSVIQLNSTNATVPLLISAEISQNAPTTARNSNTRKYLRA